MENIANSAAVAEMRPCCLGAHLLRSRFLCLYGSVLVGVAVFKISNNTFQINYLSRFYLPVRGNSMAKCQQSIDGIELGVSLADYPDYRTSYLPISIYK